MSDLRTLIDMLSYCRPAKSETEQQFIERFLKPLNVAKDQFGNHFVIIGDERPSILWSSHTDSVHTKEGKQKVAFDGKFLFNPKDSKSNCLGADDAAEYPSALTRGIPATAAFCTISKLTRPETNRMRLVSGTVALSTDRPTSLSTAL